MENVCAFVLSPLKPPSKEHAINLLIEKAYPCSNSLVYVHACDVIFEGIGSYMHTLLTQFLQSLY